MEILLGVLLLIAVWFFRDERRRRDEAEREHEAHINDFWELNTIVGDRARRIQELEESLAQAEKEKESLSDALMYTVTGVEPDAVGFEFRIVTSDGERKKLK